MKRRKKAAASEPIPSPGPSPESEPEVEEEEEEVTEESEMRRCLREKVCFFCGKPEGGCSHLLAVVDRTFGTIDRGSLAPLLAELVESLGKAGEENALEVLVEELRYVASWVSLAENDSDAAMSASRVDYFWGDAAKVEARLRADFSG